MLTRSWHLALTTLLVGVVALSGCAKRPATTQAAAPAPTGPAQTTASAPSSDPQMQSSTPAAAAAAAATATPTPPARPPIRDFMAIPELADIFFDFDKYDIRSGGAKTLDTNAAWLKSNPNHLVLIEGHCDERGTNEYNLALGERRAKSTMNYLVSQGVQANRITIISYGEERPQCSEKSEGCWGKNRRSHFLVKPR